MLEPKSLIPVTANDSNGNRIYYICQGDPTGILFEGTIDEIEDNAGGMGRSEQTLLYAFQEEGMNHGELDGICQVHIFTGVPKDYYKNQEFYNGQGIYVGYDYFLRKSKDPVQ